LEIVTGFENEEENFFVVRITGNNLTAFSGTMAYFGAIMIHLILPVLRFQNFLGVNCNNNTDSMINPTQLMK